jgi:hypothetical protein
VTPGPAAGSGGTTALINSTPSGFRGCVGVQIGTSPSAGGLFQVTFANSFGDEPLIVALTPQPDTLQVGSFDDPILRPIALTKLPEPTTAQLWVPVAVMTGSTMTGFKVFVSSALPAGLHYFAWVVL